jgi:DNA-binding transcriptional LysR family regulator
MHHDDIPRVDLRLLRQFVVVAEELHFRRAAERLGMSQPPLTAAIRRLETEIGASLIERGRTTVRLTAAGQVLLDRARRVLTEAFDALAATRDAAEGRLGRVRLSYVGSAMYGRLADALRRFRRDVPDVRIDLREMTTAAQLVALRADDLDVAIVIPPLGPSDDLTTVAFDRDRLAIALPVSHRLAGRPSLALADLAGERFIVWPREQGPGFYDQVTGLCSGAGFSLDIAQEAHGMHGVLSLVAAEAGIAIVPASMATVRPNEVAYHPLKEEGAAFELLLCRRRCNDDPAVARLLHVLR